MSTTFETQYGYWLLVDRQYQSGHSGLLQQSSQLVWFGIDNDWVLPLPTVSTVAPASGNELDRVEREYAVVVDELTQLPLGYGTGNDVDEEGFARPAFGVFVRQDTRTSQNVLMHRSYVPATSVYPTATLHLDSPDTRSIEMLRSGATTVQAQHNAGTYTGPGSELLTEPERIFEWLTRSRVEMSFTLGAPWQPGAAGPWKRPLLGSANRDPNKPVWELYAYERMIVFEAHRDGVMLSTAGLDCGPLLRYPYLDQRYLIAFGYDWSDGSISIGVSMVGTHSEILYQHWSKPELKGFGYQDARFYVGGGPADRNYRTAWGYVRPVAGGFTNPRPLTMGSLAQLSEGLV
jgi:hypothetical protein